MYKLNVALIASFFLILPVFALPRPVHEVDGLERRDTRDFLGFTGTVQVFYSHLAHISDCLA